MLRSPRWGADWVVFGAEPRAGGCARAGQWARRRACDLSVPWEWVGGVRTGTGRARSPRRPCFAARAAPDSPSHARQTAANARKIGRHCRCISYHRITAPPRTCTAGCDVTRQRPIGVMILCNAISGRGRYPPPNAAGSGEGVARWHLAAALPRRYLHQ